MFARGPEIRITATAVACSPVNPDDSANIVSSAGSCSSYSVCVSSFGSWIALVADECSNDDEFGDIGLLIVVFVLKEHKCEAGDVGNREPMRLNREFDIVRLWRLTTPVPQRS